MSACVIPLAPDFQDPVEVQNYPPVIDNTDPALGSIQTTLPGDVGRFRVRISDPNLSDRLFVLALADYPPDDSNTRVLSTVLPPEYPAVEPPSTDTVRAHDIQFEVSCTSTMPGEGALASIGLHRIVLLVADRQFDDSANHGGLYLPTAGGLMATASWLLDLTNPTCK